MNATAPSPATPKTEKIRREFIHTNDLKLVGCLLSLGCRLVKGNEMDNSFVHDRAGKTVQRTFFNFEATEAARKYAAAWVNREKYDEFVRENPGHHLQIVREIFSSNHDHLPMVKAVSALILKDPENPLAIALSAFIMRERAKDAIRGSGEKHFYPTDDPREWEISMKPNRKKT